ncbi:NUDIX domain-containing protein [Natrinema sp. H-ect4]|uniref:NUDIX hydrolase n=1 Tax=Natrinema sp. H-ect4 TaxID=3242699 RepID=UPI0035A92097
MAQKGWHQLAETVEDGQLPGTYVQKACAYITRGTDELLVFEGPEYEGLQIPKGTIEHGETPHDAVTREIEEESGLESLQTISYLTTDVWTRSLEPPKQYIRHFYEITIEESRDQWTHTVTGEGDEHGLAYQYTWEPLPPEQPFALALDDYIHFIRD